MTRKRSFLRHLLWCLFTLAATCGVGMAFYRFGERPILFGGPRQLSMYNTFLSVLCLIDFLALGLIAGYRRAYGFLTGTAGFFLLGITPQWRRVLYATAYGVLLRFPHWEVGLILTWVLLPALMILCFFWGRHLRRKNGPYFVPDSVEDD